MDHQNHILPDDAPDELARLLECWQDVAKRQLPTQASLVFDDLVAQHPGLMLVEPAHGKNGQPDLKIIRAGPEYTNRLGRNPEGLLYSDCIDSNIYARTLRIYPQTLETGEPHYWEITNAKFGEQPVQYSRLLLPIYDNAGNAVSLLSCCIWKDNPD